MLVSLLFGISYPAQFQLQEEQRQKLSECANAISWLTQSVLKILKQYCNRVNSYHFILVPASISPRWTRHTPELIAKWDKQSSMKVMLVCAEHACMQTGGSD